MELKNLNDQELQSLALNLDSELKRRQHLQSLREEAETYAAKLFSCLSELSTHTGVDEKSLWLAQNSVGDEGLKLDPTFEGVQPHSSKVTYQSGDRVTFNGGVYEALLEVTKWNPAAYPLAWKKIA